MDKAKKHDEGKLRYDLLPAEALEEVVQVYTMGAEKYDDRNWEKGLKYSRCYAALMRHLQSFWMGQDVDTESGLHHMAHVVWNAMAILQYEIKGTGEDDRPSTIHENECIINMQRQELPGRFAIYMDEDYEEGGDKLVGGTDSNHG